MTTDWARDLDDLDDEGDDHDDDGERPDGVRRRRFVLAGALVGAALLGAVLGTVHANARAEQTERALRLDSALRTGAVGLDGDLATVGAERLATLSVPLANISATTVTAELVAVDAPHLGPLRVPGGEGGGLSAVALAPGSSLPVTATAAVRCEEVPEPDPFDRLRPGALTPAAVVVDVVSADDHVRRGVRLALTDDEALQLAEALSSACHPLS
ncbi:hypothetical protein SAMN06264364_11852 [Quadrisphaera granulorum]|uniref:Uncharacterized protein n=1 Tax=Quadrisphaera granulorum TaxID=317664 RepID=A0A316A467_9ACTN|nr:hypothetical protein [Quadrisphaera granulorum]PWJ52681.1 hypothetical protein BXY45_11852 [Quadrisphaera granulorum]SZE97503.1 hypothetical protein SAMN06264364_11852 [Quadrisphaera granulorum]